MDKIEIRDNRLVASGRLEYSDFPAFERLCRDCFTLTQGDLVVDFTEVERMTSAYMGALLELMHSLAERGRGMKLEASPAVRQLVQLTGLGETIPMI